MTPVIRLLLLLPAAAGCAQVLDIPGDPALVGAGPWSCLSEPMERSAPINPSAIVRVQACDFQSPDCMTKVTGLSARVCAKLDGACTDPVAANLVDDVGLFELEVPTPASGFDGYLEVTSATELCTSAAFGESGPLLCGFSPACNPDAPDDNCRMPIYTRAMLFFNPPVMNDNLDPLRLPLIPAVALPDLVMAAGGMLDPSTGNLFVTALDCEGKGAAGVRYSIDADQGVTQLYVHRGGVSETNRETDATGVGGFLGVPVGFAEVSGFLEPSMVVGSVAVRTAPFTMTYTSIAPAPL
jgi:hypothetical protein